MPEQPDLTGIVRELRELLAKDMRSDGRCWVCNHGDHGACYACPSNYSLASVLDSLSPDTFHETPTSLKAAAEDSTELESLRLRVKELEGLVTGAPEPYEYMSKADFKALPYGMRAFVDAHRNWMHRVRTLLNNQGQKTGGGGGDGG